MNTFTIFLVLITIVALLLIVVIMVQNPKGGGLDSSLGGGGGSIGGVQNTNKFLDNSTWTLAVVLLGLILFSSLSFKNGNSDSKIMDSSAVTSAPVQTTQPTQTQENNQPKQQSPVDNLTTKESQQ